MTSLFAPFPQSRLRRNRQDPWCRDLVAEHSLSVNDLIWPVFIREADMAREIEAMPDVFRYTLEELVPACEKASHLGIKAVALFPCVSSSLKCEEGQEALNAQNLMCRAVRLLKKALPNLGIIGDVALDPYTSHGHDGLLKGGDVENDTTLEVLAKMAVVLAEAGVDIVAPSDMMDGRVGVIRKALDEVGYQNVRILAYSAKYASAFYGPFREALGSNTCLGKADKKTYQMNPANGREALQRASDRRTRAPPTHDHGSGHKILDPAYCQNTAEVVSPCNNLLSDDETMQNQRAVLHSPSDPQSICLSSSFPALPKEK